MHAFWAYRFAASSPVVERAIGIYRALGMHPLHVRAEIDAHIADRLMEAVWREALWLVHDGIATTEEIDDAIRFGFGLRWAQMGLFETYRIAGGEGGMRHFIGQFGVIVEQSFYRITTLADSRSAAARSPMTAPMAVTARHLTISSREQR